MQGQCTSILARIRSWQGRVSGTAMPSDVAARQATGRKRWLLYALATTLLWGVWGAFTDLPTQRGFPDTLVYCVWSLTMIPPALIALARAGWRLEHDVAALAYGMVIGLL